MENQEFNYIYSAEQRSEVEAIRKKYLPKEEDKLEQLRQLDASVGKKGMAVSLVLGIVGTLVLGGGMSLVMTQHTDIAMVAGIVIGVLGMILVALAYPVYNSITKKERERVAPEILRLTEELMQ